MSDLIIQTSSKALPVPSPREAIAIRLGTAADIGFIDAQQKKYGRQLGFLPRMALEGKIVQQQVLVAERVDSRQEKVENASEDQLSTFSSQLSPAQPVGYVIAHDQYFKRDDVGIVYQIAVSEEQQRGFIGAALLKAQFERSAYGCKLYCCWCAQDIAANYFWESMGFVPLAYRAGSASRGKRGEPRVHIFWQKRIRAGDATTPWWYPSLTAGGAIRADRLALPIPPGVHWNDPMPLILPPEPVDARRLKKPVNKKQVSAEESELIRENGLRFPAEGKAVKKSKKSASPRRAAKNDPNLVAAARELKDRYLEQVNTNALGIDSRGKYDLARSERLTSDVNLAKVGRLLDVL